MACKRNNGSANVVVVAVELFLGHNAILHDRQHEEENGEEEEEDKEVLQYLVNGVKVAQEFLQHLSLSLLAAADLGVGLGVVGSNNVVVTVGGKDVRTKRKPRANAMSYATRPRRCQSCPTFCRPHRQRACVCRSSHPALICKDNCSSKEESVWL